MLKICVVLPLRQFLLSRVAEKVHLDRRLTVLRIVEQGIDALEARDQAVTKAGPELLEDLRQEESRLAALETAAHRRADRKIERARRARFG